MDRSEREQSRERRVRSVFGTVVGVWLALGAVILGMSHTAVGWLGAAGLGALGLFVLWRSVPRLAASAMDNRDSEDLTAPERGERRRRCPCCGSPSLDPTIPDQSCPACEWLAEGLPGEDSPPPEQIAVARDNFRRFLSVYPPDARPQWSPDPPSEDELALRRELIELYARALTAPEDTSIWSEIGNVERRIRELELAYSEEVEARAGRKLDEEEAAAEEAEEEERS